MILIDFSGIMFQNIHGAISLCHPKEQNGKLILNDFFPTARTFILGTILDIQTKYSNYGNCIICLDNTKNGNWRREILNTYKSNRRTNRETSNIPFDEIFKEIDVLLDEINKNTPFKTVCVNKAEADDVILCLADHYAKFEKVLIVSSDKDMIQAQRNANVKQYSPLTKQFVTFETKDETSMRNWLIEHIVLGDDADEIPKITHHTEFSDQFKKYLNDKSYTFTPREFDLLSDAQKEEYSKDFNVFNKYNKKSYWREIRLGKKTLQKILENNEFETFMNSNPYYKENYNRNKILILQEHIPSYIYDECVNLASAKKDLTSKNTKAFKEYLTSIGMSSLTLPNNFCSEYGSLEDFLL